MKKKNIVLTIFLGVFSLSFFFGLVSYYDKPVFAEVSCPSYMPPDSIECLNYLRDQRTKIQNEQLTIQRELKEEEYQQLTLSEKINYITNQIQQTENTIKTIEIDISSLNIEINMLEESIDEKEDNISVLGQEINILEGTVTKRVSESYKYSFVGPLELFLDMKGLSSILRKTKYLTITRTQERESLEVFASKAQELREEEALLSSQKDEVEEKRNSIDEERIELAITRKTLENQKSEREILLAESRAKAASLQAAYQANIRKVADLDNAIIQYINEHGDQMQDKGWVEAGQWIGNMGNTGCSDGAHLHFGLNSGYYYPWWGYFKSDINLFSTGYLRVGEKSFFQWGPAYDNWISPYLHPGSLRLPLGGQYVIMTQTEHQGNAIDMVAYNYINGTYQKYYGAPVYSIMPGNLKIGVEGVCNGEYAEITHPNGMVSIYLHLQRR
jgi:peptidoglycan hydrolase CwlO-like protein